MLNKIFQRKKIIFIVPIILLILVIGYLVASAAGFISDSFLSPDSLDKGLVLYYPFDGNTVDWRTNTVADISGNGNNGTLVLMSATTSPQLGKIGQALKFNDDNDYINAGSSTSLNLTSTFTLSAWVKPTSAMLSGSYNGIIRKGFWDYSLSITQGKILAYVNNSSAMAGRTYLKADTWYLLTWVHDSSDDYLYVNGVLDTAGDLPDSNSRAADILRIGGSTSSYGPTWYGANGLIDDVRIYNRALSPQEVGKLYKRGQATVNQSNVLGSLSTDLVGHWTFDGPDTDWHTNTLVDSSDYGNDATIVGLTPSVATMGVIGQAFNFPGTANTYASVTAPTNDLGGSTTKTISAWVNIPVVNSHNQVIFMYGGFYAYDYGLWMLSSAKPNCHFAGSGSYNFNVTLTPNQWYLLTCTLDSTGKVTVYVNGQSTASYTNGTLSVDNDRDLAIGYCPDFRFCTWDDAYSGKLDDLRIYNRTLSAAEVEQLYNSDKVIYSPSP